MEMIIIGLGKMGTGFASQALKNGIKVTGLTLGDPPVELVENGIRVAKNLDEVCSMTSSPRKIFLYVPAGPVVEEYIEKFIDLLNEGDIVMDGGNSYWGDSIRRYHRLKEVGVNFLDVGTSGGISGAREGACFMIGGDKKVFEEVKSIFISMASPDAVSYIGPAGCGHLVKLIHNGIEFGMLQAIGEGMALLEKCREQIPIDMEAVFSIYRNGSVIRSWLIDLMGQQYKEQGGVLNVPAFVEDTGEVNWLLNDALRLEVPIPVISQSVMELFRSRDDKKIDYRSVAMMRHGFGGHPFGPKEELRFERATSRISHDFIEFRDRH